LPIKENIKSFKNMDSHGNKQENCLAWLLLDKLNQREIDHLVECLLSQINQ